MLSKVIKGRVEARYGFPVRYPKDCDALANEISNETGRRISNSTLKRLLGFVKGTKEPRLYTLDIIAEYLGYKSYDELINELNPSADSEDEILRRLVTSSLEDGSLIKLTFDDNGLLILRLLQNKTYQIVSAQKCQFEIGDTFLCDRVELNHPLFVNDWMRGGVKLGSCVIAKISGILSIIQLE